MSFSLRAGACLAAVVTAGSLGVVSSAAADAHWGQAGCGWGYQVYGAEDHQVMAFTTNNLFAAQSFAISSGTSGCGETEASTEGASAFIQGNRDALAKDISRGNGETISNLTTLAGCGDSAAVGSVLQSEYEHIFPAASVSDTQVSEAVLETLRAHAELSCSSLS